MKPVIERKELSSPMFLQLDMDTKENILNGVVATSNSGVVRRVVKHPLKMRNASNVNHNKKSLFNVEDDVKGKYGLQPDVGCDSVHSHTGSLPKVFNLHDKPPLHHDQVLQYEKAERRIIRETARYLDLTHVDSKLSERRRSTAVLLILHEHEKKSAHSKGASEVHAEDNQCPELILMSNCREDCKYVMNHFHSALGRNRRKKYKTKVIHRNEDGVFTEQSLPKYEVAQIRADTVL